ncbi:MAG: adenylate/guanylate cyclase domain-containing protein [Spirochaetales bacterium]|nr:adenylate/guanylate cyclase domain-containing protein [Spirochaetales bacterium]
MRTMKNSFKNSRYESDILDPLKGDMEKKINLLSKIVLCIATAGFLVFALFELFFGKKEVFFAGFITTIVLIIPMIMVFLNKIKPGIIIFIIVMTGSMISTQIFYIYDPELLGLMMIDFSVYFGLIITSGFILIEKRYLFIIVFVTALLNGIVTAFLTSGISLGTKRFFLIEIIIFMAIGCLVYYFTYLYNAFLNKARLEMQKQRIATEKLIEVNKVFGRFVPNNFLRLLNKKNIMEVRLGDQIQMHMTVMFADIRSFTTLSEKMTPKENFEFLNSLLKFFGPTVRHFQGFVDKYIGDAVLSLFPIKVSHAVSAAVEIQRLIALFNKERIREKKPPVKMGFGINSGDVIAGIIGEEERMEETVISDAVNIASRLESLTKLYGSGIIISGDALGHITEEQNFQSRFLDNIQVEGKILPVSVFEVLDLSDPEQQKRFENKDIYKTGWDFYCDGRIDEAIEKFEYILALNPDDIAAEYQLLRCRAFLKE